MRKTGFIKGILLLLICILCSTTTVYAQNDSYGGVMMNSFIKSNDDFKVTVYCPSVVMYSSAYVEDFVIECENLSDNDFSGKIQLFTPTGYTYSNKVGYETYVSVSSGKTWKGHINGKVSSSTGAINVCMLDKNDKNVFDEIFIINDYPADTTYINAVGILSDNPDGITITASGNVVDSIADGDETSDSDYIVKKYNKINFPNDFEELNRLSCITISDFNLNTLSDSQWENLKKYVCEGGNIILGTGDKYEQSIGRFSELLTFKCNGVNIAKGIENEIYKSNKVQIESSTEVRNYNQLEYNNSSYDSYIDVNEWDNYWTKYYAGNTQALENMFYPWISNLDFDGSAAIRNPEKKEFASMYADIDVDGAFSYGGTGASACVAKQVCRGYIYIFGVDLAEGNIDINFNDFMLSDSRLYGDFGKTEATDVAFDSLHIQKYIIMIFIYVLLVSVVLYYILKKIGKRNLIWIAIPCISFTFAIVFYVFNSNLRVSNAICSFVEITDMSDTSQAVTNTVLSIVTIDDSDYTFDIDTDGNISLMSLDTDTLSGNVFSDDSIQNDMNMAENYSAGNYDGEIEEQKKAEWRDSYGSVTLNNDNAEKRISLSGLEPYATSNFSFRTYKKNNGGFTLDVKDVNGTKKGTITNNTNKDMEDVIVATNSAQIYVGDLSSGQTTQISFGDLMNRTLISKISEEKDINFSDINLGNSDGVNAAYIRKKYSAINNYNSLLEDNTLSSDNQVLVLGQYEKSDEMGDDWDGVCIAKQIVTLDVEIDIKSDVLSFNNTSSTVGSYYENTIDGYEKYLTVDSNVKNIGIGYDNLIMLYDIPKEKNLVSIDYLKEDNEILKAYEKDNGMVNSIEIMIFNYKEKKYQKLFNLYKYKEITEIDDFYGDDKPVRILIKAENQNYYDYTIPNIRLELEEKSNVKS